VPPRYQVTAGEGAFEVAVNTTTSPPGTLGLVGVMLTVGVCPPPPLPGAEAIHPANGSRLKNTIARDQARFLEIGEDTTLPEIDIVSLRRMLEGSVFSIFHVRCGCVKFNVMVKQ
jgi:hypothetical protein